MSYENKRVAILATNGFEEVELSSPKKALEDKGVTCHIISPLEDGKGKIRSWDKTDWGKEFKVDKPLSEARIDDYHMLVLPGGVLNPDKLRLNKTAVSFVHDFVQSGKPVAAICHGTWLLAEAGVAKNRKLTSYHSIKTDMQNAGADWQDREVVVDDNLVTSRSPKDLDAFNGKILEMVNEAVEAGHSA